MSRLVRQFVVTFIFLAFTAALLVGVYYAFIWVPETCNDVKKNQDEQGIDCGGVCTNACIEVVVGRDFVLEEVVFVPGGEHRYDVLGKIYNGNDDIGAALFRYVFELKDGTGRVIATRSGESYILPQETKSLLELNLETTAMPASVVLTISQVVWERFSSYQEKPNVSIYQKRYSPIASGGGFGEVYGLVSNESPYDFRTVMVNIILRDASGKPLAVNRTTIDTFVSGQQRDFKLVWPLPFPGTVDKVDMEVDADVYHSENFVEQYFPRGER